MSTQPERPRSRYTGLWFPVLLTLLLLMVIPAALVLALTVAGKETAVNGWLEDRLKLSFHIPLSWLAALVLLLAPVVILLLYFLKMKRKPLAVPSTFLWKKSIEDIQVNSLFQWLRNNVLLLLQLLLILVLIYAVLDPHLHTASATGRYYILLVDNSASMACTDTAPTRLAAAKQKALDLINAHRPGDVGMVVEFNSEARIRQPYTSDAELLRIAVEGIRQTNRRTRISEALAMADSLPNPRQSTDDQAVRPANEDPAKARTYVANEGFAAEVHLITDGGFGDAGSFAAGNLDLHYHRIGKPSPEAVDNVGIVTLNASRDEREPGKLKVFVRVLNYRKDPATVRVDLDWRIQGQDEFELRSQDTTMKGRTLTVADPDKNVEASDLPGEGAVTFSVPDAEESDTLVFRARLRKAGELGPGQDRTWHDSFALDDEAWLVVGVVRKARVLIVTEGNDVLRHFFKQEATEKVATVDWLKPEDLASDAKYGGKAREGAWDLVIFDRCAPEKEELLPQANTFFIDSVPPPWKRSEMPELKGVHIRNPDSPHALMRHLTALDEIAFTGAFRFELDPQKDKRVPPGTPRLLECDRDTAVLFALQKRPFTDLVLAFPLVNSKGEWTTNWNLKLSFPLFLRNVLYNLGNVSDGTAEENVSPGKPRVLRPDASVEKIEVFVPGAKVPRALERTAQADFLFKDTEQPGVYSVHWQGGRGAFAVNLLDEDESNVQPRDMVQVGAQQVTADQPTGRPRELWPWVLLAALVLLVVEWAFYHRRIFH
jgi:hypothetical protein